MAVPVIRDPAGHQFPRRFKDGIGRPGHQMVVETLDIAQKIKRRRRGLALLAKPGECPSSDNLRLIRHFAEGRLWLIRG